jgi:ABC-2 type transport system ATP-binding protein/sodium transport system ATP-binding protein
VGTQVIFDYIARLRDEGKAVVVCTHRLDEASRLCDRFGLLHRGQMRHQGTLEELRSATGEETLTQIFLAMLAEPFSEIHDGKPAR